jgi:cytoskeletal protein RodZ
MATRRKRNLNFLPAESRAETVIDISAYPVDIGVGELMRLTRERLGHELQTVANQLRIRLSYLEAIEDARFRDLPGTTYAVGFVRSYADYLGLDGADIVRRFREEAARIHGQTKLVFPALTAEGKLPRAAVLLVSAVGLAAVYGVWYYISSNQHSDLPVITDVPDRLAVQAPDSGPDGAASDRLIQQSAPEEPQVSPPAAGRSPRRLHRRNRRCRRRLPTASPEPPVPRRRSSRPAAVRPLRRRRPRLLPLRRRRNRRRPRTSRHRLQTPARPRRRRMFLPAARRPPPALIRPLDPVAALASRAPQRPRRPPMGQSPRPHPWPNPHRRSPRPHPWLNRHRRSPRPHRGAPPVAPAAPVAAPAPPAAPAVADNEIPAAPAAPAIPGQDASPQIAAAPPAGDAQGVVLEARMECWIKVVDAKGKTVTQKVLKAGESYAVPDQPDSSCGPAMPAASM